MRVIFGATGSLGDILPFFNLGTALKERGHEVYFMTNAVYEPSLTQQGFGFCSVLDADTFPKIMAHPDFLDPVKGAAVWAEYMVLPAVKPAFQFIQSHADEQTLVVAQKRLIGARLAQEKLGTSLVTVHLSPYEFNHFMGIEPEAVDQLLGQPINQIRDQLGFETSLDQVFHWLSSPTSVLGLFPDWFHPNSGWPPQTELIGFPMTPPELELPEEAIQFLDAGSPPVVFIPGTFNNQEAACMAAVEKACEQTGHRAIFLGAEPGEADGSSPHILRCKFLSLSALLPRASVLIHHGGVGTTAEAFRAGTPQIVVPRAYDQGAHAVCVARLGVGATFPPDQFQEERVAGHLQTLTQDPDVHRKCDQIAAKFVQDQAMDHISRILEEKLPPA